MSLLDKASLVVTPNAYKESKLYSVVPNTTLGDMDVVRATTATRINSAGLVEVVPRNLFTYSEEFDNAAWSKFQATITANDTIAPNGSSTADKLASSTNGTAVLFRTASTEAGVATISVYAKAGTNDVLDIGFTNVSDFTVKANLTTGTITSATSGITGTITNVGNGWYRVTATRTMTASGTAFINSATTISGRFIYIWGGQLDLGNATEYFPTTTRLNMPRIDYSNGSCPSLLVEPQRTNLILYSEQFDNADWMKVSATITANTTTSPSGVSNADTLVITSGGYLLKQILSYSAVTGQKVTASIFTKNQITDFLQFGGATPAGTDVYSIETISNGWYRHKVTRTFTTTAVATLQFIIYDRIGTHFIWGGQVEAGAYATSYIPTIASSVTRNADVISKTGISSLIGQTEGTLFCDVNTNLLNQLGVLLMVSNGTFANFMILAILANNKIELAWRTNSGTINRFETTNQISNAKIAVAYQANNIVFYVNGALINTGSVNVNWSIPLSQLDLGNELGTVSRLQRNNSVQLYKTRLSNDELVQLTTL